MRSVYVCNYNGFVLVHLLNVIVTIDAETINREIKLILN
jgi:hypothetical protein